MVVINNLLDYQINLNYIQHIMSMDTVALKETHDWRAIDNGPIHNYMFMLIIMMESITAILCWLGGLYLFAYNNTNKLNRGKDLATMGLTLALIIWFGVFFIISGEWFLAWQTPWNALPSASRIVTMTGIALIFIHLPENTQTE